MDRPDMPNSRRRDALAGACPGMVPSDGRSVAVRKLDMLNAATELNDLQAPPGNRLEALKGDLKGKHSIRINDRWRLVVRWERGESHDVEITDYH